MKSIGITISCYLASRGSPCHEPIKERNDDMTSHIQIKESPPSINNPTNLITILLECG
jgi:hypothetical protein